MKLLERFYISHGSYIWSGDFRLSTKLRHLRQTAGKDITDGLQEETSKAGSR